MKKSKSKTKPARAAPNIEATAFTAVVKVFSKTRDVELGGRFGAVSLKSKGKTFAMLFKGRLVVKLPNERVAELVKTGAAKHFDPGHGRLMKQWAALARHEDRWVGLAREAHAFVTAAARKTRPSSK